MTQFYTLEPLKFQPLSIHDRGVIQSITLAAGRRNCNFTFANLIGWQFWFGTERCILPHTVILRVRLFGDLCYMICSKEPPDMQLLKLLCLDASQFGDSITLLALEDSHAEYLKRILPVQADINPRRNNYDYIYLRRDLEQLAGKHLKAKRNHVNKFLQLYPQYEYRPLSPQYFNDCRQLAQLWRDETDNTDHQSSVNAEQQVMENIYAHWDELDMIGGSIWIDGKMVAFTYGAPVTFDTFDVCVEKADRNVDGAFNIINQQFASRLPEQYVFINREEDMGLEGLRKAKLSYHPHILLGYNTVTLPCKPIIDYNE